MKYCASTRAVTDLPTPPFSPPMKLMELMRFLREWDENCESILGAGLAWTLRWPPIGTFLRKARKDRAMTVSELAAQAFGACAEDAGWPPPLMSPGFASSFTSLRGPPGALGTGDAVSCWPRMNHPRAGSRRWCALRSEIKEEPEGRGTFAEQSTPSA